MDHSFHSNEKIKKHGSYINIVSQLVKKIPWYPLINRCSVVTHTCEIGGTCQREIYHPDSGRRESNWLTKLSKFKISTIVILIIVVIITDVVRTIATTISGDVWFVIINTVLLLVVLIFVIIVFVFVLFLCYIIVVYHRFSLPFSVDHLPPLLLVRIWPPLLNF